MYTDFSIIVNHLSDLDTHLMHMLVKPLGDGRIIDGPGAACLLSGKVLHMHHFFGIGADENNVSIESITGAVKAAIY